MARVFIYVQHLLGIGHFKRAAALARALSDKGFDVTLASGGRPVPGLAPGGVRLVQLPPALAADESFKALLDAEGNPVDEAWRARRRNALLYAWRAARPDALVIELFPFGRRQMRFELLPLLEEARSRNPRPVIACSVRDVIQSKNDPARVSQTLAWLEDFDHVLVHGDPAFLPFGASFPQAARIAAKLHYTGYVVECRDAAPRARRAGNPELSEVLVSAGGGAVGRRLLETAIRCRPLSALRNRLWRVLGGINLPSPDFEALRALADEIGEGRVVLERNREDFRQLLAECCVSVSQGGYNTVIETLSAGARALVVPFSGGTESEQALRARLLHERRLIEVISESDLTPESLARAIDLTAKRAHAPRNRLDLKGGERSAALIREWTTR